MGAEEKQTWKPECKGWFDPIESSTIFLPVEECVYPLMWRNRPINKI